MTENPRSAVPLKTLIILASAAIVVIGFFIFQNLPALKNTSKIQPSPNLDILNWKTYRNEKYSFEIKYPQDYFIIKTNLNDKENIIKISNDRLFEENAYSLGFSVRTIETDKALDTNDNRLIKILNKDLDFESLKEKYGSGVKGTFLGDPPWGYYYVSI